MTALRELAATLDELQRRQSENRLAHYKPYPKQAEFHALGATKRERLLMAGNQLGKTLAGAMEMAMHLTGTYPDWWTGRRFSGPVRAWASGVTSESVRDTCQRLLLGPLGAQGTGAVPAAKILEVRTGRGIPDAVDHCIVEHVSGGKSYLGFKSYERGREKWQGETLDVVWTDEEPPADIYSEALARISARNGIIYLTFTPLMGVSSIVARFLSEGSPDRAVTVMTIEDAAHIAPEERARIVAGYLPHERDARTRGIPMLGSGRIFGIAEEVIRCEPVEIPPFWPRIGGLDFGWDHPTAAAQLAWDRDADCVYVTHAYRQAEAPVVVHAGALRPWGVDLPWAWPHDGLQADKGSGVALAEQFRSHGLNFLAERATFPDGSNGLEAGLFAMLDRMQTGRWKVFRHLTEWFEEFRLYHRKDGRVVKERDDLMSASRYALMMLRHARTGTYARHARRSGPRVAADVDYDLFNSGARPSGLHRHRGRVASGTDYPLFDN